MPGGVAGIPVEYTERKRKKKRKSVAANAKPESWKGGRPLRTQDYVIHRIAELIRVADGIQENEEARNAMARGGITLVMADGTRVNMDSLDEIALAVGCFMCGDVGGKHLKPEYRPYVLRQLANVLETKARKSSPDDIAKIRAAWREAKADLKGLYKDTNPTFAEVDRKYHNRNGWHLDRRALNQADDCPVRPDKRGVKKNLPRPTDRNRGKG